MRKIIITLIASTVLMMSCTSEKKEVLPFDKLYNLVEASESYLDLDINTVIIPLNEEIKKESEERGMTLKAIVYPQGEYFVIEVNTELPEWKYYEVIAHEMIHVKQYVNQELILEPGTSYINFKGIRYNLIYTPYAIRPWETEAFVTSIPLEKILRKHDRD